MVKLLNKYHLGDMNVLYYLDEETKRVELNLLPDTEEVIEWSNNEHILDSLVQIKLTGDTYNFGYANGRTLHNSETTSGLEFISQEKACDGDTTTICTVVRDARGNEVHHFLGYVTGDMSLTSYVTYFNHSSKVTTLEYLPSFSLGGVSPLIQGASYHQILAHRLRGAWCMEARKQTDTLEELQLESSYKNNGMRVERFGQAGSMPTNGYFPYLVIEDKQNDVFWGAQIAHNASWQMEMFKRDEKLVISGGLADREFGHWMKTVEVGESFTTPKAIVSVCKRGGIDGVSQRMAQRMKRIVEKGPECEQSLPIMFNEWCTTWGDPSHDNICAIVDSIKGKGIEYFIIDCGWYREPNVPWDMSLGDYEVSPELFPEGLEKTVAYIKEAGMKPGIWFEIDNVGPASHAFHIEEHLLKKDGAVLTTGKRRFWDMNDPWVQEYLDEKVIKMIKKYGFEYVKMDYNDTIGIGCDGAESLGEGLRKNMEASIEFIRKMKREIPDLIIENCASGGSKLEPLMIGETHMSSFSDAFESDAIPIIGANLQRVMIPAQSQIWAVIRKHLTVQEIVYKIVSTFMGRLCYSGDVLELNEAQWDAMERGTDFYKKIIPIVKNGHSHRFGNENLCYQHPEGWQAVLRKGESKDAYVTIHSFYLEENLEELIVPLEGNYVIDEIYSDADVDLIVQDGKLIYKNVEAMRAVAVYLKSN